MRDRGFQAAEPPFHAPCDALCWGGGRELEVPPRASQSVGGATATGEGLALVACNLRPPPAERRGTALP